MSNLKQYSDCVVWNTQKEYSMYCFTIIFFFFFCKQYFFCVCISLGSVLMTAAAEHMHSTNKNTCLYYVLTNSILLHTSDVIKHLSFKKWIASDVFFVLVFYIIRSLKLVNFVNSTVIIIFIKGFCSLYKWEACNYCKCQVKWLKLYVVIPCL